MKNILLACALLFLFSSFSWTQAPSPTATPGSAGEDEIVKITTNLIQVDVTVTDSNGRPVTDIRPDEMEVFENGKKQDISNFLYVPGVGSPVGTKKPEAVNAVNTIARSIPPPIRPEAVRRTIALVVDDLSLSADSVHFVRIALKKFVDEQMRDGDLVAIIRTGAGIGALQQFTSDKRMLYAAIERVHFNLMGKGGFGAFTPIAGLPPKMPGVGAMSDDGKAEALRLEKQDKEMEDFRSEIFSNSALDSLRYIVRGMQQLPGRKSIMFLTNGVSPKSTDLITRVADIANRASVTINTIDARGLLITGFTAADSLTGRTQDEINARDAERRDELHNTQDALAYLSESTGGRAIQDANDLGAEVRRILDDQGYYLIGYQPADEIFKAPDLRFNKLEVKVRRKGVTVHTRSGFFGITDQKLAAPASSSPTPQNQMMTALTSPFSVNDLSLNLNVLFGSDVRVGPYLKPLLYIDGGALRFVDGPNGSKKATFQAMGVIFGDNGQVVDRIFGNYTYNPGAEEYKEIMKTGFVYNLIFPMRKPGAYQFRVVIRDQQNGKIGSASQFIEVPDLKKKNLTVSSVVLNNVTIDGQNRVQTGGHVMSDAAVKRFKKGSILHYAGEIYNAKNSSIRNLQLQTQVKIFSDGNLVMSGKLTPLNFEGQNNPGELAFAGALQLGTEMPAGRYIMQIDVVDGLARGRVKNTGALVEFEIVE